MSSAVAATWIDAFREGLRQLSYIEGKNIVLEIRGGGAKRDRLSDLAAELIGLKVDIIVATANLAVRGQSHSVRGEHQALGGSHE
ncbi:MAG TPA: hypothetical protein VFU31_12460 [Candidatus Binatia bacterium]|nr:hypothetical protein [Candidatus Binatia bacterium]